MTLSSSGRHRDQVPFPAELRRTSHRVGDPPGPTLTGLTPSASPG